MVIVLMGVSGCGKTTIGQLLAKKMDLPFFDADNFHPAENIAKMHSGIPLNDDDRAPWLDLLNKEIQKWNRGRGAVLACSALKQAYRNTLTNGLKKNEIQFVYLKGEKKIIAKRLSTRGGHYMPTELLDSQFQDLEEPADAINVSITESAQAIANKIFEKVKTDS